MESHVATTHTAIHFMDSQATTHKNHSFHGETGNNNTQALILRAAKQHSSDYVMLNALYKFFINLRLHLLIHFVCMQQEWDTALTRSKSHTTLLILSLHIKTKLIPLHHRSRPSPDYQLLFLMKHNSKSFFLSCNERVHHILCLFVCLLFNIFLFLLCTLFSFPNAVHIFCEGGGFLHALRNDTSF